MKNRVLFFLMLLALLALLPGAMRGFGGPTASLTYSPAAPITTEAISVSPTGVRPRR